MTPAVPPILVDGMYSDPAITALGPRKFPQDTRFVSIAAKLLRVLPFAFPLVFIWAAIIGSITFLYAAVMLHVIVIGAENTAGRWLAKASGGRACQISRGFEDACLFAWPVVHLAAFAAALYLIILLDPTTRQAFAIGAIFGYSVNTFAAVAGHEMVHRPSSAARACADVLSPPCYIRIGQRSILPVIIAGQAATATVRRRVQDSRSIRICIKR
jgi:hypothetical protein